MINDVFTDGERPPVHLLASESDMIANLALQIEHRSPVIAALLLEEIERAELHDSDTLPDSAVTLNSTIDFIDENTNQLRTAQLVLPADANISLGRISILTPVGAALYGLMAGDSINWPDLNGNDRRIQILRVSQPVSEQSSSGN